MKKWMAGLLALFLLLIMPAGVMASANVKVDMTGYQGNGNYATWEMSFDVAPVLTGGRVLVPFREIAEAIGAKVGWDQKRQTVTVVSPGGQVKLVIGQKSAYRNGGKVTLDVPAQIVKGRTMVPLRLISEALGAEVDWKQSTKTVTVVNKHAYVSAPLNQGTYWLDKTNGDLFYAEAEQFPLIVGEMNVAFKEYVSMKAEQTPQGNVLLTIADNYGEPHIHNDIYNVYLRGNIVKQTAAYYWKRLEENVHFYRDQVVMTDGKKLFLIDDNTGQVVKTYDLVTLGGEDDNYFVEGIGDNYLLIRPNNKGFLTLVDLPAGKRVLLYKLLLDEKQQTFAETNDVPFFGDYLKFVRQEGRVLTFQNRADQVLGDSAKDEHVYQYTLQN